MVLYIGLSVVSWVTTGDLYPQIFPGFGGWVLVACLSAAGCLWAGVWRLVWMWSVWVVQVDMDEASDFQLY